MKLTGALFVLAAFLLFGFYRVRGIRARLDSVRTLASVMEYVIQQIRENRTPTEIIYSSLGVSTAANGEGGLYFAYPNELARVNTEEREIFRAFSYGIGSVGAEGSAGEMARLCQRMREREALLSSKEGSDCGLNMLMALFFGILLTIILI